MASAFSGSSSSGVVAKARLGVLKLDDVCGCKKRERRKKKSE